MALVLNLDDYKAPQLEVDFGFKKVSVALTDDTTSKMSALTVDANRMLKEADKLTDDASTPRGQEAPGERLRGCTRSTRRSV